MRRAILLLLIFVSVLYSQTIREMRFENVKLETVLKAISEASGMNIIFDPEISKDLEKVVSVAIYKPVPVGEAMNIILKTHGLIAVPVDKRVYRITKAGEITFDIANYTDSQVNELINLLKARVSPSAEIIVDRALRKVFVRDELSKIEQLRKFQKDIERASRRAELQEEYAVRVFYLKREVSYKDISNALEALNIKDIKITESPEFNALIISARKGDLERIEKAIEKYTRNVAAETPILTKTLYVKYIPADEFKKLVQPMLSEVGEVYVLGTGATTTGVAEERELREIQQRIREISTRFREATPEERAILQQELRTLQARQRELERAITTEPTGSASRVNIGDFPTERDLRKIGPEFKKEKTAILKFQNALIIRDYADVVYRITERYKDLISETPLQIRIEARVVQIVSSATRELGINWTALLSNTKVPQAWSGGVGSNMGVGSSLNLNPGLSATPGGILALTYQKGVLNALNLRLSALERIGQARVLSKPVVLTLNGEPAIIQSVTEFPIRQVTVVPGGTTSISIEYKQIPIYLAVTPILLPEGSIMLDITINKSEIIRLEEIDLGEQGGKFQIPTLLSQRADTKLIVGNGDLVILGGIVEAKNRNEESGVPGLMRVPLIRWLFMEQKIEKEDTELLIFIQPTVITQ